MFKMKTAIIVLLLIGLGFGVYQLGLINWIKKGIKERNASLISENEKPPTPSVYHVYCLLKSSID